MGYQCHCDMLCCTVEVATGSAVGERLKKQASEASRAGVWGGELGPFPLLSPPLGSLCLPFFYFVFVFVFSVSPQLLPFLPTTERGPRPAIDGFCVVVRRYMVC